MAPFVPSLFVFHKLVENGERAALRCSPPIPFAPADGNNEDFSQVCPTALYPTAFSMHSLRDGTSHIDLEGSSQKMK